MKYHIDKTGDKPAYLQLYTQLRTDIVQNVFPYGTKLPSKRLLAEELDISVITVEHAYAILCDEGYAEARQRSGYFVIYREGELLSVAESTVQTFKTARTHTSGSAFSYSLLAKTMRKVLADYGERILVKSPNHGCAELRAAICAYLARSQGISVRAEQIIIGSGAEYLYSLLAQMFRQERVFALEDPSYEKIRRVYLANGKHCDMLALGADGIKSEELVRTQANILHITPFESYPSGVTASASKRAEYLRWAEKRGGILIEDNYNAELSVSTKNEDTVFSLSKNGSVIYLNTFSQTIAPSLRVGYMVLPERLTADFDRRLGFYSCTVPVFDQYVLAELLQSGDFERHINRVRRNKRKEH